MGYGQLIPIASIVATGAGLHVAAYYIEHKSKIGALGTVLSVAIPVSVFLASIYTLYSYMVDEFDRFHLWLLIGTATVIGLAVLAAAMGVSMPLCLIILMFAPVVSVVGFEAVGHRHQAKALSRGEE